ncbi:MAG: adenylate/guanylate cyclase domain-containing protein [Okeania sp. SIO2G4]|nr:adenylate/guanylate cyclase domain-containing protein [Okeania sp. SIO2H7]NEP74017.1 adenylate/guanylate cyclase domain-containing protein [Okeania sp. SIO2G5]NEP94836.1 adenylate/guanylate cyclase domain-containing protein [Okeania sp. SIO2F5]NEQ93797.1 adenylate/guanylate cyclase domain-containing protein [Okeania sp. SIO2G4]
MLSISSLLLLNILLKPIAEKLKEEQENIAESFAEVTILFADLVGFTQLSENIPPTQLVNLLNEIFSCFDELTDKYYLEKIKTNRAYNNIESQMMTAEVDN